MYYALVVMAKVPVRHTTFPMGVHGDGESDDCFHEMSTLERNGKIHENYNIILQMQLVFTTTPLPKTVCKDLFRGAHGALLTQRAEREHAGPWSVSG